MGINISQINNSPINKSPINKSPINESPVNESQINKSPINQSPNNKSSSNESPITNPQLTNHKLTNHKFTNHELTNPKLTNHQLTNHQITNPQLTNPQLTNPQLTNHQLTNLQKKRMAGNFEELHCWQACYKLKVYLKENLLSNLPKTERYELNSQILRAARSATANIAEGWGRFHYKENINFLRFSRGSVAEILDHSIEAKDCNYINDETLNEIRTQTETCIRLINGYIRYLRRRNDEK